eukprot:TRINITY_DN29716_c0_g1_i1.p1 TRINITY_DN29716_c0_g1~~TRINITY_DN29716_c0_g1_i1.p1  ORF type:complete len:452 (+),score=73.30 TRINITY_DN29716_c0_g1_i1:119-1357(+)
MAESAIAVIMVGGPTKGTRFRPLSLYVPKPLFPVAGEPMVFHPIQACKKIPNLTNIFLIGFYDEKEFTQYCAQLSNELKLPVRYLREDKSHGSAGGLNHFKDRLLEESPKYIFVLNCDICSSFPLDAMLEAHKKYGGMGTLLVKKVPAEVASEFGELVADGETCELLHYAEKPETFVSELINCGVYIFSTELFDAIKNISTNRSETATLRRTSSFENLQSSTTKTFPEGFVRLDQDILTPYAGKKKLYTYETKDFWEQIKTPGMSLRCSELYLSQYAQTNPSSLAKPGPNGPTIVGSVSINPSAKVSPSAKLGPNVSIGAHVRIGPGVRLVSCIILDEVEVKENAIVMNAIIGWKSTIGRWARVQGAGDWNAKLGISILGEDVTVEDEVVVVNCIVLPHKSLGGSVREEIIL